MILREITQLGILGKFHLATVRFQVAGEATQQGRLADAVGTDNGDTLTDFDQQVQVAEQRLPLFPGPRQPFDFQRQTIKLLVLLKTDIGIYPARGFNVLKLDFVNLARS